MTAVKPNKKISYGIARQREAIELIGRRFEQIGTIRQALAEEKSFMTKLPDDPKDAILIRWKGREEKIEKPEIWLKIFENVARDGDAVIREIITRRYNNESYWKTCDDLYISTGMYYNHVKDILGYAFALAVAYGVVNVPADNYKAGEKVGKWIESGIELFDCSVCGYCEDYKSPYCPDCGAKMEGEHNEQ